MVYGLGCRMKFKRLNKLCIINEKAVKKPAKIWICDLILKCHELSVHLLNITSADRQEVLHIELSLTALSCTLYAHLHRTVEHCHFTLNLYDNDTAAAIARHVGTAAWRLPIYHYDDYTNWEIMQYYDIPSRYEIPSNPESVTSVKAGAVYYSEPNRIILFYGDGTVSSEYTPVGYITNSQDFVDAVENNPVLEGWGNKIVHISD